MTTVFRFLEDAYQWECPAIVVAVAGNVAVMDQTVFYPGVGASIRDKGWVVRETGEASMITGGHWVGRNYAELGHVLEQPVRPLAAGERVTIRIDRDYRLRQMRVHTALHLVSVGFPFIMAGARVGAGSGYIEFLADRTGMSPSTLHSRLRRLIARDDIVSAAWVLRSRAGDRAYGAPFQWPERSDLLRTIEIGLLDVQPCDGLHVRRTSEIGAVKLTGPFSVDNGRLRVGIALSGMQAGLATACPGTVHASR